MSFKRLEIYPPNPSTARGASTKLSSSKDKVIYASGRSVVVRVSIPYSNNPFDASFPKVARSEGQDFCLSRRCRQIETAVIQNPSHTAVYSGHIQNATVARISPSGYYCASADITGKGELNTPTDMTMVHIACY